MPDTSNTLLTFSTSSLILSTAPRAATAAGASARWRSHRVAPEGAAGSRRERNIDVEVLHCRSIEMLGSFNALCDYRPSLSTPNVRGQVSWLFGKRTRVLRRSVVIDRSPSVAFVERHRGRHRFIFLPK